MDKHRQMHELLVKQGSGVPGVQLVEESDGEYWFEDPEDGRPRGKDAEVFIELAAIKWLMGRATAMESSLGMTNYSLNGGNYQIALDCRLPLMGQTLIDALHAAVEREVSND